jgi:mannose-1-phosphate guanylyltransferase/phosphomannomutase
LGCEVISLDAYTVEHGSGVDPGRALALLSSIVQATDSTAGFWLDPWAERVYFIDEKGKIYRDLDSFFLLLNLMLKAEESGVCAVPLFVPSSIDYIAKENNFGVLRTKNSIRALSESARNRDVKLAGYPDGRFIFPEFQIAYDGMFAIAKMLELMAGLDIRLSEVSKAIPEFNFHHATVPCPWEAKGVVMRMASQDAMGMEASFLDGVKVSFDGSWVLIFPDQYKSLIHLYTEADTENEASSLRTAYTKKIENWIKT